MGALRLAWADLERGRLDQQETQRIRNTVSELVEDLESHNDSRNAPSEDAVPLGKLKQLEEIVAAQALDRWMQPWRCRSPSCCAVKGSRLKRKRRRRFQFPSYLRWN